MGLARHSWATHRGRACPLYTSAVGQHQIVDVQSNHAMLYVVSVVTPFPVYGGDRAGGIGGSLDGGRREPRARLPKRLRFLNPAAGVVLHRHRLRRGVWGTNGVQVILECLSWWCCCRSPSPARVSHDPRPECFLMCCVTFLSSFGFVGLPSRAWTGLSVCR